MDQNATALDTVPPLSPVTSDTEPSIDEFDAETAAAAIRNVPYLNRPYSDKFDHDSELPALQIANGDPDGLDPIAEDDLDPGSFDLVMPVDDTGDGARTHGRSGSSPTGPRKSRLEQRSELLFSRHHLHAIFADPAQLHRFSSFLCRYRPASVPLLDYYTVALKALRAIRYSNAVLARLHRLPDYDFTHNSSQQDSGSGAGGTAQQAPSTVNRALLDKAAAAFDVLTHEDLPAYVTHVWIRTVSVSIRQRVMGRAGNDASSEGLAEVFCLTDPSRPDNPIVFMSEQFNRTTQYGVDYVIGRNCRFLQGPCTNPFSVKRIRDKLEAGIEHYETFLNYRRDGSPFMNLVMLAPLYDSRGKIRYHIGAQVDVSGLAMSSYDLGALDKLVDEDPNLQAEDLLRDNSGKDALTEFAEILAPRDLDVISTAGGRMHRLPLQAEQGLHSYEKIQFSSGNGNEESSTESNQHRRSVSKNRVVIRDGDSQNSLSEGKEDDEEHNNQGNDAKPSAMQDTPLATIPTAASLSLHHNGRLTGVYEHYLLVRPHPSLRILFTSPSMRVPGILQSPLLDRIGGSTRMRQQLVEALSGGQSVTAKIKWLSIGSRKNRAMPLGRRAAVAAAQQQQRRARFDNSHTAEGQPEEGPSTTTAVSEPVPSEQAGRSRWLHCTPLMGAQGKVGVWMIVLVDDDEDDDGSDAKTKARRRGGIVAPIIQTQAQLQQQTRRAQSVMSNKSFGSIVGEGKEMEAAAAAEDKYDQEMVEEWQQRVKRPSFETLGYQRAEQPKPQQPAALPSLSSGADDGNLGFATHTATRRDSAQGSQQRTSKPPRMSAFRSGGGAGGSAARFFRLDALSRASRGHQNASKQRPGSLSGEGGSGGGGGGDYDKKKGEDNKDQNSSNLDKKNDGPSSSLSRVLPRQVPRTPPWLPRRGRSVIVVPEENGSGGSNESDGNKDGGGGASKQRAEEDDMSSLYSKASAYTVRI